MMSFRFCFVIAVSLCLSAMQIKAVASPVWLHKRPVIFDVRADEAPVGVYIHREEMGRFADIGFELREKTVRCPYGWGIWLSGCDWENRPQFIVNGRPLELDPLVRSDGLVIPIPAVMLGEGRNSIRLLAQQTGRIAWDRVVLFPLLDSFEDNHFNHAFADPVMNVAPPRHSSQVLFDVLHCDLALTISMSSTDLTGILTLTARALADGLQQVALDFDANGGLMAVQSVTDGGEIILPYSIDSVNDWLLITLPSALATSDTFTVRVNYQGRPATDGTFGAPYRRTTHNGTPIVYTFSEPYGARKWWPCKDLPDDKFTIDLHITAPDAYFVVSNGTLTQIESLGGGLRRFHYSEAYPITSYLVSIACTNYQYYEGTYTGLDEGKAMRVGHYIWPERSDDANGLTGTLTAMQWFAQSFGEYPFINEKYVTATHSQTSSMEHQTATSLRPGGLDTGGFTRSNIHELAHSWFGNKVTCRSFEHLWLNEGFATWCEAWLEEYRNGSAAYLNYVSGWDTGASGANISDYPPLVNPNADAFSGSVVYRKGAFVLHMLRHVMGDERFLAAIRSYLTTHAYDTVLTPDFQAECETAYGAPLDWFFQQWVYNGGRPSYQFGWRMKSESESGGNTLSLTIEQTQSEAVFIMPLDVRVSGFGGETLNFSVWNDARSQTFDLPVGDVLPLTVALDPDNWVLDNQVANSAPTPTLLTVRRGAVPGEVVVQWASGGGSTSGFEILTSENMMQWHLAAVTSSSATQTVLTDAPTTGPLFVMVRALAASASPSTPSDVYGAAPAMAGAGAGAGPVLVVDGYDRWESQGRGPSHPWAAWTGMAISAVGEAFDACANEQVISGAVNLSDYKSVVWVLGEESETADTFNSTEQTLVMSFLKQGGRLFVTGAEVGWDLDYKNNGRAFYNDYLKADYVADDSQDYDVTGSTGGIFEGLAITFDNGTAGIYFADWPDVIAPLGGAVPALEYSPGVVAGVQFDGVFPGGQQPGRLVYFGFGFETIYPETTRNEVMRRVMQFFGDKPSNSAVEGFYLH